MVLKNDQERVKTLLKDTITLLCKNGLTFKDKFSIDAVIGVTLDESDVFLISMNEIVKSESFLLQSSTAKKDEENAQASSGEQNTNHKRHRRKRKMTFKTEPLDSGAEDRGSEGDSAGESSFDESGSPLATPLSGEPPVKKRPDNTSGDTSKDNDDIVFIKEELDDSWVGSSSQGDLHDFTEHMQSGLSSHDPGIPPLSGMNLVPVGSQPVWLPTGQPLSTPPGQYRPRAPRSSTVTSEGTPQQQDSEAPALPQGKPLRKKYQYRRKSAICDICGANLSSLEGLKHHQVRCHGIGSGYTCGRCGKMFTYEPTYQDHVDAHSNIKRHKCMMCEKCFSHKNVLISHTKTCSRDKTDAASTLSTSDAYRCNTCGMSFAKDKSLKEHIKGKHTNRRVICPNGCGATFKWRSTLRYHIKHRKC